jgi:lipid-A-disaccharide synthase
MVYGVAPLTWKLGRRLVKVDRFSIVNLIAERDVVPELVQADFTPQRVCEELRRIIPDGEARATMMEGFAEVRRKLEVRSGGESASDRAAAVVLRVAEDNMNHRDTETQSHS